jgi:hypothetical protein
LITIAASPPPFPVDRAGEAPSVRSVVKRLSSAPSDREWRYLQDLATTIERNASLWIGVPSSERREALLKVRNVLLGLEPDLRRLAAPNLDPRRIAFLVVECARAAAPADFAEAVTDNPDQAYLNVHVLRTMILRSLEHLQRVALRDWTERNMEDQQPARGSVRLPSMERGPDPSVEEVAKRLHNLDLAAEQLTGMLKADLSDVGTASPALDTPLPSPDGDPEAGEVRSDPSTEGMAERQPNVDLVTDKMASRLAVELTDVGHAGSDPEAALPSDGDLETDIKDVLSTQLKERATPLLLAQQTEAPEVHVAPETAAIVLPEVAQSPATEPTLAGEMPPELAAPPNETDARQLADRSGMRSGLRWSARFLKHRSIART